MPHEYNAASSLEVRAITREINLQGFAAALMSGGAWLTFPNPGDPYQWGVIAATCALSAALAGSGVVKGFRKLRERREVITQLGRDGAIRFPGRFATDDEMAARGMFEPKGRPMGITFSGRVFYEPPNTPVSKLLGAPGTAKTAAGLTQAVMHLALQGEDNTCTLDGKDGEIAAQCVGPLTNAGVECVVIDPRRATKLEATNVNWLRPLLEAMHFSPREATTIARDNALTLEPEPKDDHKNRFWRDGKRTMLTYGQLSLALHAPHDCSPSALQALLSNSEVFERALAVDELRDDAIGDLARQISDFKRSADMGSTHYSEFLNTARKALEIYEPGGLLADDGLGSTFSFSDIKRKKLAVFIVGKQRDLRILAPHYVLVLRAFMQAAKVQGDRKITFICDEFTNTPLQGLVEDLTILRGYGGRVILAAQAESEIERKYGREAAATIRSVSSVLQVLGVTDWREAEAISKLLGQGSFVSPSIGLSDTPDKIGLQYDDRGYPVMTAAEIIAMPRDQQLIFIHGMRPIRARKLYQNQISPICHILDANPLEGGVLPPDPIVHIYYERLQSWSKRRITSNRTVVPRLPAPSRSAGDNSDGSGGSSSSR